MGFGMKVKNRNCDIWNPGKFWYKHGQNLGWKMRQMYGKRIKGIGLDLGRIYWIEGIKNELGIGIEPGSKLGLHIVGRFYDSRTRV